MSKKNRKRTYDNLVLAGRLDHIDSSLTEEFGKPKKEKMKNG